MQDVTEFASVTGKGVTGRVDGRQVAVGNAKLLGDLGGYSAELESPSRRASP